MNQNNAPSQPSASPTSIGCSSATLARGGSRPPGSEVPSLVSQHLHLPADQRRPKAAHLDPQALGSAIFTGRAWEQIGRSLGLSDRELQVVRGVFDDQTELAIAGSLGISPHTVHTHFDRLHRKLGISTRTGLVLRVTREFLALTASPAEGAAAESTQPSGGT